MPKPEGEEKPLPGTEKVDEETLRLFLARQEELRKLEEINGADARAKVRRQRRRAGKLARPLRT